MRALVLLAAVGAACGGGLMEAVREGLGIEQGKLTSVKFSPFGYYCTGKCPSAIKGQRVPDGYLAQVKSGVTDLCVAVGSVVAADGTVTVNNMATYTPGQSPLLPCNRMFDSMSIEYKSETSDSTFERNEKNTFEQNTKQNTKNTESTSPPIPSRAAVLAPAIMGVVGTLVSMLL